MAERPPARLDFLDGLRGWGSLSVLLYHLFCVCLPIPGMNATALLRWLPFDGPLAVWVFFIVSGFSLSIGFVRSGNPRQPQRLLLGRYVRLAGPIVATACLTYMSFRLGLIPVAAARPGALGIFLQTPPSLIETLKFSFSDVFFAYNSSTSLVPPLGTIHAELYGSALILGMLLLLNKNRRRFGGYLLAGGLAGCIDLRYASFIVGVLAAEAWVALEGAPSHHRHRLRWLGMGIPPAIFGGYWLRNNSDIFFFIYSAILVTLLIFTAPTVRFLSNPLSKYLGRISFSLFLIHVLIFYIFSAPLYRHYGGGETAAWAINLSTIATCLAAATVLASVDQASVRCSHKFADFFLADK